MRYVVIKLVFIICLTSFFQGCGFIIKAMKSPEAIAKEKQQNEEIKIIEQKKAEEMKHREFIEAQRLIDSMPICDGESDCNAKWEAAQAWVIKNCSMKLETTTSMLIETYSYRLGRNIKNLAAKITKEPITNGKYRINIELSTDTYLININEETYNCIDYINKFGIIKGYPSKHSGK